MDIPVSNENSALFIYLFLTEVFDNKHYYADKTLIYTILC